jgi:hypothetical protein
VWRIYLLHVRYVLISNIVEKDKENRIDLARRFGMFLYRDGRFNKAKPWLVQVMETLRRLLGAEHPKTLVDMNNLAQNYIEQGQWKKAEDI